jgi:hypothetical protein
MSLMNPGLPPRSAPLRQAASLRTTLAWLARHAVEAAERAGQRRAAPVLRRLGQRLSAEGRELGPALIRTADTWSAR